MTDRSSFFCDEHRSPTAHAIAAMESGFIGILIPTLNLRSARTVRFTRVSWSTSLLSGRRMRSALAGERLADRTLSVSTCPSDQIPIASRGPFSTGRVTLSCNDRLRRKAGDETRAGTAFKTLYSGSPIVV